MAIRPAFLLAASFQPQPRNTAVRNKADGPRLANTGVDQSSVAIRWHAFSVFRTVNFQSPETNVCATNFGGITPARPEKVGSRLSAGTDLVYQSPKYFSTKTTTTITPIM